MAVSINEALSLIQKADIELKHEMVCIENAVRKVSASSYKATLNLPIFDNSAMDGYAVKLSDAGERVKIVHTIYAGDKSDIELTKGKAIKIMTGAKIPEGTEAIVPIEDVEYEGEYILLPKSIKPASHIRKAGEDVAKGEPIIQQGDELNAYRIGLLASQGISHVSVYKRPKIAIFSTGHEIKMAHETLEEGQIYNSNTPSLYARCLELGCEVSFIGKVEDSLEAIKEAIGNAMDADLIVTSGGVSVGEADFTKDAFKELGMQTIFSKVDIKPGKPTTLGKIDDTFVLNLPGNPLAAILNFEIFGRFLINRLSGYNDPYIQPMKVSLAEPITHKPGRDSVIPGIYDGSTFKPLQKRNPGMVRPASLMNGFIILSKEAKEVKKEAYIIPIDWNFRSSQFQNIITS